jgi:DNA-directed RNA polymerase subunit RPC12/RpoP
MSERTTTASGTRFPCGQCGAELSYAPGTTLLTCAYCGFDNPIDDGPAARPVAEQDYAAHLRALADEHDQVTVTTVKCGACGAETDKPPHLDALECVFCGADIVATESTGRIIPPRSLLPFHVTAERAHAEFRAWIRGLWFAPSRLKRYARSGGRMQGVYVPYWTYDAVAISDYTGRRGEHYWVTETYTTTQNGKRVTRTRQVRKTRWYPAAGRVRNDFDDLLVVASHSLPPAHAQRLEPWDLENLVPYRDDYLAGFRAERYQVDLASGFAAAQERMEDPIRATIRRDIGGDVQSIHSVDTRYHDVTFKHLLLPVWISAYRFREKVYRTLVNARTGEVQGERPWSAWKIVFAVLAALAVIGVVAGVVTLSSS